MMDMTIEEYAEFIQHLLNQIEDDHQFNQSDDKFQYEFRYEDISEKK
jgi:hypothetical protein